MIEYAQVILPAVILLDRGLFCKELIKCVNWTENPKERMSLVDWCYEEFGDQYADELNSVFSSYAMVG